MTQLAKYLGLVSTWLILAFLILPSFVLVPMSFSDQPYLSFPKDGLSLDAYRSIVHSPVWRTSIVNSLIVCVSATFLATSLGTLFAIGCWKLPGRVSMAAKAILLLPMIVPAIVHALAFFKLMAWLRLLDTYAAVIITHTLIGLPYVVISVSTALAAFDPRVEQAARSLGASEAQTIRLVIIPSIRWGILSGAVIAFIMAWDEIVVLLFVTSRKLLLLPKALWNGITESFNPAIAAITTILIMLTTALTLAQVYMTIKRENQRKNVEA